MNDIFDVIMIGYFDALNDANNNGKHKNFNVIVDNQFKSKLYDIAYVKGYNDCLKHFLKK